MRKLLAGVDEAGRGPLAGPVLVAAVILDPRRDWSGLDDSKRLDAERRRLLARRIRTGAAWSVCLVDRVDVDRLNVLAATLYGMAQAVAGLPLRPERVLVDGNHLPELPVPAEAVIGGDGLEACISAASILAKTARDAYMEAAARRFPGYGFERHKGYGTPEHLACLRRLGPSVEHRRSFAPVRACLQGTLL